MKKETQGKRVYTNTPENPGEYSKRLDIDGGIHWYIIPPKSGLSCGCLDNHEVIEHEDGTITVTPSILLNKDNRSNGWHGYLTKGIWREC